MEQSDALAVEKHGSTKLPGMSQGGMLKEKQSEKMMSKEEQLSEGPWYIHEQMSWHTQAAQDERVHRQEEMVKMHRVAWPARTVRRTPHLSMPFSLLQPPLKKQHA